MIKASNIFFGKRYPSMMHPDKLRTDSHHVMHVNEPTWFSLHHHFGQYDWNYKIRSLNITMVKPVLSWKDVVFNAVAFFHPLSKYFPLNLTFGDDFIVIVEKRGD